MSPQHAFPIKSPWVTQFKEFVTQAEHELYLVSPYISSRPLQLIKEIIENKKTLQVQLITSFELSSLQSGSLDANAVADFAQSIPNATVIHLPRLHAKIYLSELAAITTSANLTNSGLEYNYEYGTLLTGHEQIAQVRTDLQAYLKTGSVLGSGTLSQVAQSVERIQKTAADYDSTRQGKAALKAALFQNWETVTIQLLEARIATESLDSIFQSTILYVMAGRPPLTTPELHTLIQFYQPDLCDDTTNRVINGIHFGKKWKHQVRTAQQGLKRRKLIDLQGGKWYLCPDKALEGS